MGCKGSKKVLPFRYFGLRQRKNRVESLQGGTAFNVDIHPARSRLNRNISNRINIDEVFSDDFGGFNAGEIKYRSPTPIRAGVPGGMLDTTLIFPAPRMKDCNADFVTLTDSGPSMKTDTTWVAGQVLKCEQEHQVAALNSPNDTSRLPPLYMCKLGNEVEENQKTDNSQEVFVLNGPVLKTERPMAAEGYRKAFLLNRPSLPDIPACEKRQDNLIKNDMIELDSEKQMVLNNPNTLGIEDDGNIRLEDGMSAKAPSIPEVIDNISEEHERSQITAVKGQREYPLFRQLSAPTIFLEIGKQHEGSGSRIDHTQDLVLEDIEDLEDLDI